VIFLEHEKLEIFRTKDILKFDNSLCDFENSIIKLVPLCLDELPIRGAPMQSGCVTFFSKIYIFFLSMFLGHRNLSCNIFPGSTDKLQVSNELPTDRIKLMKGIALRKHSLHEKTAASVLLKLFISSN